MPRLLISHCAFMLTISVALAFGQTAPHGGSTKDTVTLSNSAMTATWSIRGGQLRSQSITNHFTGTRLPLDENVFELLTKEGAPLASSAFKIVASPVVRALAPAPLSPRGADQLPGHELRVVLEDASSNVRVIWEAVLRDHANYLHQRITIRALRQPLPLTGITLIDAVVPGAEVSGHVKGSPVIAATASSGSWFLGFEHPLSECRVRAGRATCWLSRELPLQPGLDVSYSSVIGVTHPTQLRRDFLHYLELERAHPYRTFLHYNSWYDLGYFDRYNEQQAVDVVQTFGDKLTQPRGV
jgi:hypothetical protein